MYIHIYMYSICLQHPAAATQQQGPYPKPTPAPASQPNHVTPSNASGSSCAISVPFALRRALSTSKNSCNAVMRCVH